MSIIVIGDHIAMKDCTVIGNGIISFAFISEVIKNGYWYTFKINLCMCLLQHS